VLLSAVLFGTSGTAAALGPAKDAVSVGCVRVTVAAVTLVAIAALCGQARGFPRVTWPLLILGGLGSGLAQLTFFVAVQRVGVAMGTVIALGSAPLLTGLLAPVFTRRRPSLRWALASGVAIAGLALVGLPGGSTDLDLLGLVTALAAGLGVAVLTLAARQLAARGRSPLGAMAWITAMAAVLVVPVLATRNLDWLHGIDGQATALYLGVVSTALALVCLARGLRRLTAPAAVTLGLAEPLTAALLGIAVLGEPVSWLQAVGGAVMLGAGAVLSTSRELRPGAGSSG
jgi:DME family drug/metabolite transporter